MFWLIIIFEFTIAGAIVFLIVQMDRSRNNNEKMWKHVRSGKIKSMEIESGGKGITAQGSIKVNNKEYKVEDLVRFPQK